MGLCKCPKRQVTNLFCFEHRVNVCENCMVQSHPKCIVQSYLQWLRDSDYVSNCTLCCTTLENDECVRLICYHVFHWKCLNIRYASLPINTTPRGHMCPVCDAEIFPTSNLVSPVADALKTYLSKVNWGRNGLGLAMVLEDSVVCSSESSGAALKSILNTNGAYPSKNSNIQHSVLLMDAFNPPSPGDIYASNRRPLLPRQSNFGSTDFDENKYKRRTSAEIFSRWSRRFYTPSSRPLWRRPLVVILSGILLFFVIVYITTTLGQSPSNDVTAEWINPNPVLNAHYG